jgi:transcriptional regulator with XRE-family HTH domain
MRHWRKYKGLTQTQAGERVDIDQATLGRIERGVLPYNQDLLERLALAYGCDVSDLLEIDPLKPDPPRLVYEKLRHAPPAMQKRAIEVLEALLKAG